MIFKVACESNAYKNERDIIFQNLLKKQIDKLYFTAYDLNLVVLNKIKYFAPSSMIS